MIQAEATNAAIHGLDDSVKTVTDSIQAQTKTVTDLGSEQSKVTKEISKTLNTQNSRQKDANTTLAEQKKIRQEQETEIKKVTKAVNAQTGVLQKNAGGWKMPGEHSARDSCSLMEASENSSSWVMTFWPTP